MTSEEINTMKYKVCCPMCDNKKCVKGTDFCEAEQWAKSKAECADESSLENPNKWISVKDRMPKDGEWVLCQLDDEFYDENTMMVLYHTDDYGEKWVDGGLGTGSYDVCAWMPLPKPYKEDNNG